MVIEIVELSIMNAADINDTNCGVGQILIGRFAPLDGSTMQMGEYAASEEVVFVGSTRMGHDGLDGHAVE